MPDSPSSRVLRSSCRNHGSSGCTCYGIELEQTPRRRSLSRTPSRASSVAPEMIISSSLSTVIENDGSHQRRASSVQRTESRSKTLRYFSQMSNAVQLNERVDERNTCRATTIAESRKHLMGYMETESSSLNNSSAEINGYHRKSGGVEILPGTNGSLNNSYARIGSVRSSGLNYYYGEAGWDYVGIYFKRACTSVTQLVHYILMNLFVCEKWLLHREGDWNNRSWKKIFWLILMLLTGWCLWNWWPLMWYPLESLKYPVELLRDTTVGVLSYPAVLLHYAMQVLWYPVGLLFYSLSLLSTGCKSLAEGFSNINLFNAPPSVPASGNCRDCSSDSAVLLARIGKLEERMDSVNFNFQAPQNQQDRYASIDMKILDLQKAVQEVRDSVQNKIYTEAQAESEKYQLLMSKIEVLSEAVHANRKIIDELKDSNSNWKLEHQMLQRIETLDQAMKDVQEHARQAVSDQNQSDLKPLLIKLESKVESMEKVFNDQYSKLVAQLNMAVQNWELKLEDEVTRIETKHTQDSTGFKARLDIFESKFEAPLPPPRDADPKILSEALLPIILPTIMESVHQIIREKSKDCEDTVSAGVVVSDRSVGCTDIEKMIRAAIAKYDADKTGLPDVALEPAGGSILSTRCTKSSRSKNSVLTLWGWRLWSYSNSPRSIIQPGVVPGDCWAVDGATAEVVIQLISPTVISGFTVEHIPKSISPYGKIDTAPRRFEVVGIMSEHDIDSIWNYGSYEYEDNNEPLQYFKVQNFTKTAYPIVELRVLSNHGNIKSTCIYRFRVHGEMTLTH